MMLNELSYLRKSRGISQQQLAAEVSEATGVNVNQRTISSWELGNSNPRAFQYQFLEDFFRVPKEEIFRAAFEYQNLKHRVGN